MFDTHFSRRIAPHVMNELAQATAARAQRRFDEEFSHLENAHVLGQESTYWHVYTHVKMAQWAIRNQDARELFGQLLRIVGAATKTAVGLVPSGNTGGARISPFTRLPIDPELARLIDEAKH